MIWFSSDYHLGHSNIIKYCNRPFKNVDEMNEIIIENHNRVVKPNDDFYHLGDFVFKVGHNHIINLLKRLNGNKYFILGNHDRPFKKDFDTYKSYIVWVKDYYELSFNKKMYILSHYPFCSWNGSMRGSVCLHGHCHNSLDNTGINRLDVGIDNPNSGYSPMSIEYIDSFFNRNKNVPTKT